MKKKLIMALLGLVLILTGCTRLNASVMENNKNTQSDDEIEDDGPDMIELEGEIGVENVKKELYMPIPEDLSRFIYFEDLPEGKGSILLVMFENGDEEVSIGNFAMYSTLEYDSLKKQGVQLEDELFRDYDEGYVLAYSGAGRDIFDPEKDAENYGYLKEYESRLYEMLGNVRLEDAA